MNVSFLFGAGISLKAGLPSTSKITEQVLSGKNVIRDQELRFLIDYPDSFKDEASDDVIRNVLFFLNILKTDLEYFFRVNPNKYISYEDIYNLVRQLNEFDAYNIDDVTVYNYIKYIKNNIRIAQIPKDKPELMKILGVSFRFKSLIDNAESFIRDIVVSMLRSELRDLEYLKVIHNACLDNDLSKLYLFSLNHDSVIENFLISKNHEFENGFKNFQNPTLTSKVKFYDKNLLEDTNSNRIYLIKLHGSLNWNVYSTKVNNKSLNFFGEEIPQPKELCPKNIEELINSVNEKNYEKFYGPLILMGTNSKPMNYSDRLFVDLFYQFYNKLYNTNRLIVAGYSFGDVYINERIFQWLDNGKNKMVIIDPNVENLKVGSRGAVIKMWDLWESRGKIIKVPNKIEDVNWMDLKEKLI